MVVHGPCWPLHMPSPATSLRRLSSHRPCPCEAAHKADVLHLSLSSSVQNWGQWFWAGLILGRFLVKNSSTRKLSMSVVVRLRSCMVMSKRDKRGSHVKLLLLLKKWMWLSGIRSLKQPRGIPSTTRQSSMRYQVKSPNSTQKACPLQQLTWGCPAGANGVQRPKEQKPQNLANQLINPLCSAEWNLFLNLKIVVRISLCWQRL